MSLVDVGCGPGTITLDLATRLPQGHVWGIDPSSSVIERAKQSALDRNVMNVSFMVGDVLDIQKCFEDVRVDVVQAHQVLQHVQQPVAAMQAMRSILKPSGILAVRETDFSAMAWYPRLPELEDWRQKWIRVSQTAGCDPDAGRKLVSWALAAGFKRDQITATAGTWCYSTEPERKWWGGMWKERVFKSEYSNRVVEGGFGTQADIEDISKAWQKWTEAPDGWFALLHGEVVCKTSR